MCFKVMKPALLEKMENNNLAEMIREVDQASTLYKPAGIWEVLTPIHMEWLKNLDGLHNFKLTVNMYYSQWMIVRRQRV